MKNRKRIVARRQLLVEPLEARRVMTTISFADVTSLLGEFQRRGTGSWAGVAWFDYDNDGNEDLFMAHNASRQNRLFENNGDATFTEVTESVGLADTGPSNGVVAGDIDNDGFMDLMVAGAGDDHTRQPNILKLYRNVGDNETGDRMFVDITEQSGLTGPLSHSTVAMADINVDGYLDVFVAARVNGHMSQLYLNNGDLTFFDITDQSGVKANLGVCANAFSDYDLDGDPDLFVAPCDEVNFIPSPVQLFRNDGSGKFTDVTVESGLDVRGFWMGLSFADADNDGDQDFFATNYGGPSRPHAFFQNNGDGTFSEIGRQLGVAAWEFGWGASLTDFDNDGLADLAFTGTYAIRGFDRIDSHGNPGRFFYNTSTDDASLAFSEASHDVFGFDLSSMHTSGMAHADFNEDGFLDLMLLTQPRDISLQPQSLFLNSGNDNHWVGVELEGTTSNRDAVGARVHVEANGLSQVREVQAGTSFASMDSQSLRFGLGERSRIDVIRVHWPSGLEEWFYPSEVDTVMQLMEGQGSEPIAGDTNFDGEVAFADFLNLAADFGNTNAAWGDGDFTGDRMVTFEDFLLLAQNFGKSPLESESIPRL